MVGVRTAFHPPRAGRGAPGGPRDRGFTLVEFVVAVAILAVLVGLLIPAVQKVREAAARAKCANNLKQIGIAFYGYHDTRGHFPRGGTNSGCAGGADWHLNTPQTREAEWSWAYIILPHLGYDALHSDPNSLLIKATPIPVYYCPARRPPGTIDRNAKIDYAGNAGDQTEGQNGLVMRTTRGVVRLTDVTDGASNTVLVGGKQLNGAMLGRTADDNEAYCVPGWNDDWEVYRWGVDPPAQDVSRPGDANLSRVFGGPHVTGFTCAFADGSVRFIRYVVNPITWRKACVRNDSQGFNLNDL